MKNTSIITILCLIILGTSCKKEEEKTPSLKDFIVDTWVYKQTFEGSGNASVTNLGNPGEYIKFNADNTFEINSTYVFTLLQPNVNPANLPRGRYALVDNNQSVLTLFGDGLSDPQNPNSPIVQEAWTITILTTGTVINKLQISLISDNFTNTDINYTIVFEK